MKWIKNNVTTQRKNWQGVIAKFDNSSFWFGTNYMGWTGTQINEFREVGKVFGSKTCEIKYLFDDGDNMTEPEEKIMICSKQFDGTFSFYQEEYVPVGTPRKHKDFTVEQLLER